MTDSVYYLNTGSAGGDGTGGIDVLTGPTAAFSSLASAESTLQGVVPVGDTITINCKGSDSTPDGYVFFDGWTIGGHLIIQPDESSRHNGVWNPDAYTIGNGTGAYAIRIAETNITIRNTQIVMLNPAGQNLIYLSFGNDDVNIYGNIIKSAVDFDNNNSVLKVGHSGMSAVLEKNIVIQFKRLLADASGSGESVHVVRNTIVEVQRVYTVNKTNKALFTDNLIFNSPEGIIESVDSLSNYNATDSETFGTGYTTNANDLVNQTIDFVDSGSGDYRIVSTSPLKTAGSSGGQIGAYYEEGEPIGSVISEAYGIKSERLITQLDSVKTSTSSVSMIESNQKITEITSAKVSASEVKAIKSSQFLLGVGSVKTAISTVNEIKSEQIVNEIDSVKISTSKLSTITSLQKVASLDSVKLSASAISAIASPQKIAFISDSGGTDSAVYAIKAGQRVALLVSRKSAQSLIGTIESKQLLTSISSIAVRESALSAIKSKGIIASLSSYAIKTSSASAIKSIQNVISIDSYAIKVSTAYAIKSAQLTNGIYKYTGTMPTFGWDDVVTISKTKTAKLKSETKLHSVISTSKTYNTDSKTKIMRVTNDLH